MRESRKETGGKEKRKKRRFGETSAAQPRSRRKRSSLGREAQHPHSGAGGSPSGLDPRGVAAAAELLPRQRRKLTAHLTSSRAEARWRCGNTLSGAAKTSRGSLLRVSQRPGQEVGPGSHRQPTSWPPRIPPRELLSRRCGSEFCGETRPHSGMGLVSCPLTAARRELGLVVSPTACGYVVASGGDLLPQSCEYALCTLPCT